MNLTNTYGFQQVQSYAWKYDSDLKKIVSARGHEAMNQFPRLRLNCGPYHMWRIKIASRPDYIVVDTRDGECVQLIPKRFTSYQAMMETLARMGDKATKEDTTQNG